MLLKVRLEELKITMERKKKKREKRKKTVGKHVTKTNRETYLEGTEPSQGASQSGSVWGENIASCKTRSGTNVQEREN